MPYAKNNPWACYIHSGWIHQGRQSYTSIWTENIQFTANVPTWYMLHVWMMYNAYCKNRSIRLIIFVKKLEFVTQLNPLGGPNICTCQQQIQGKIIQSWQALGKNHVFVTHVFAKFSEGGSRIRQFQQKPPNKEATIWIKVYITVLSNMYLKVPICIYKL